MKIPTLFLSSIILVFLAFAVSAAPSPEVKKAVGSQLFHAGEFQIDTLYQVRTADMKSFEHGGGLRVAYFPWRAAGFGLEGRSEDVSSAVFDRIGANLIGRFPIDKLRLAPEIRVGVDYDMEDSLERGETSKRKGFDVYAGIGGELRLAKHFGIFAEVRGVRPVDDASKEHVRGLAGIRLSF